MNSRDAVALGLTTAAAHFKAQERGVGSFARLFRERYRSSIQMLLMSPHGIILFRTIYLVPIVFFSKDRCCIAASSFSAPRSPTTWSRYVGRQSPTASA